MVSKGFIGEDFLLGNETARALYHEFASGLPIIDYHCHLPPSEIADDRRYENLSRIWLAGDHYKWRAMRSNGIAERYCTGDASDWEKFEKWAATVPHLLRNPLYTWTHLELKRYFGISDRLLSSETAMEIWEEGNERLTEPAFSARGLMAASNVLLVCTTDDPVDGLEHHKRIAEDPGFLVRVLPSWRPDKGMAVKEPAVFNAWLDRLAAASDTDICDLDSYMVALRRRHDFFHSMGCRLSDHGLETAYAEDYSCAEVEKAFCEVRAGKVLNAGQVMKFKSAMLYEFAVMDCEKDWTQQFHFGAMRNNNSRMFAQAGPDTGFDSIGDQEIASPLARLLDRLDSGDRLCRTILYNLNPRDNAVLATMTGNFQSDTVPGKMQHGSAWWFLDQQDGIQRQIEDLSQMGLLSRFVGMLTDSRSFLSYTRHEYFRRILCNLLGTDIENGELPNDMELLGGLVENVCYHNAKNYFGMALS